MNNKTIHINMSAIRTSGNYLIETISMYIDNNYPLSSFENCIRESNYSREQLSILFNSNIDIEKWLYFCTYEVFKLLLDLGVDIKHVKYPNNRTLLHFRCIDECKFALCILKGADVNAKDKYGNTPLCYACRYEPLLLHISLLLEAGADPTVQYYDYMKKNTPLHYPLMSMLMLHNDTTRDNAHVAIKMLLYYGASNP